MQFIIQIEKYLRTQGEAICNYTEIWVQTGTTLSKQGLMVTLHISENLKQVKNQSGRYLREE